MSGALGRNDGILYDRGTRGHFWLSTPYAYTYSHYLRFSSAGISPKGGNYKPHGFPLCCVAFPSRALRSLPLSVMLSGILYWSSGGLSSRGAGGYFWSSAPYAYANSRYLYFNPTNVNPKNGRNKPDGYPLRCVARFICVFLPELSAAFLFRLCCRAISAGTVVISSIEVRAASSGYLHLAPTPIHDTCTSTPLTLTLRVATISLTAWLSAAPPVFSYAIIVLGFLAQKGAENFTSESDGRKEASDDVHR